MNAKRDKPLVDENGYIKMGGDTLQVNNNGNFDVKSVTINK